MTQGRAAPAVLVADGDRPREGGPQRKEVAVAVGVLVRADGSFLLIPVRVMVDEDDLAAAKAIMGTA